MAKLNSWRLDEGEEDSAPALAAHQLTAAAAPHLPLERLASDDAVAAAGNFHDLEELLEQLGSAPLFRLGNPLPDDKHLPRHGLASCPAAHNRALLDEDPG